MVTKLVLEESQSFEKLIYRNSKFRVYETATGVFAIGDGLLERWDSSDNRIEKLSELFKKTNSSKAEFVSCLESFGIKTDAEVIECMNKLEEALPMVDETEQAKKVQRWVFNIQCLDSKDIDKSINYSLADVPEEIRQYLAKEIVRHPSNRIYAFNDNAVKDQGVTEATLMHWGDLDYGKKADQRAIMSGRGTGHFGTGFYFVNKDTFGDMHYDYNSSRPVFELDTSAYRLYKPQTNSSAYYLHDTLKMLNSLKVQDLRKFDENRLRGELDDLEYEYDEKGIIQFIKKYEPDYLSNYALKQDIEQERWSAVEDYAKELIDDLVSGSDKYERTIERLSNIFGTKAEIIKGKIRQAVTAEGNDQPATEFMKSFGYEGIDVSEFTKDSEGLQGIDNFAYGSVIYDLKPGTYKKILDPRKEKKSV